MQTYLFWRQINKKIETPSLADFFDCNYGNFGNIVRLEGFKSLLDINTIITDSTENINRNNIFIHPLSNQLGSFNNNSYSKLIQDLHDINYMAVGLGIQSPIGTLPTLSKNSRELLNFIYTKTTSTNTFLGVRGKITENFINNIYNTEIAKAVGCVSQFISTPTTILTSLCSRIQKKLQTISVNAAHPEWSNMYNIEQQLIDEIIKTDGIYIITTHLESIVSSVFSKIIQTNNTDLSYNKDQLINIYNTSFFKNKSKVFTDINEWVSNIRKYDYNVSSHVQGSMASYAAGVPSFLFAVDTRTQELAEHMLLPHIVVNRNFLELCTQNNILEYVKKQLLEHDYSSMIHRWQSNAKNLKSILNQYGVITSFNFTNEWCV